MTARAPKKGDRVRVIVLQAADSMPLTGKVKVKVSYLSSLLAKP